MPAFPRRGDCNTNSHPSRRPELCNERRRRGSGGLQRVASLLHDKGRQSDFAPDLAEARVGIRCHGKLRERVVLMCIPSCRDDERFCTKSMNCKRETLVGINVSLVLGAQGEG